MPAKTGEPSRPSWLVTGAKRPSNRPIANAQASNDNGARPTSVVANRLSVSAANRTPQTPRPGMVERFKASSCQLPYAQKLRGAENSGTKRAQRDAAEREYQSRISSPVQYRTPSNLRMYS